MNQILVPYYIEIENGVYLSHCHQLRAHTFGDTREEAIANLQEAVSVAVESLAAHGNLEALLRSHGHNINNEYLAANPVSIVLFEQKSVLELADTIEIPCITPEVKGVEQNWQSHL